MAVTTTGNVGTNVATLTYYKKKAQDFLRKNLYFNRLGTQEQIEKFSGQKLSVWRIDNNTAQTTVLTEGTAPTEIALTATEVNVTLSQYGAFAKISDLLELTGRSNFAEKASEQLAYNSALSLDVITRNEFRDQATAAYANNTSSTTITAGDVFTTQELRRTAKKFGAKDVRPGPEDDLYTIILHPDQEYDLAIDDKVGGWLATAMRRTDSQNIWKGEISRFAGFRILHSSQIDSSVTSNGITTFRAIAAAPGAVMNVGVDSMPFNLFWVPSSQVTLNNPLAQTGAVGWKAFYAAKWVGADGPRAYTIYSAVSEAT